MVQLPRTLTAALAAVALALAGCSGGGQASEAGSAQLVLGNNGDVLTWDPAEMKEGAVIHYAEAVYDPLLRKTADSKIEGNLASEYAYNDDLTELTLKLRDGVTFSDDTALDGEAVKVNIEARKKGAGSASEAARAIERVEVVDPKTVRLHLSEPSPGLLAGLATYLGYMVSPKALAAGGIATTPVGSGPYLLDAGASEKGVSYKFTAREGYWNREAFPFETVVIRPYEEFTARYNALATGQIQFMYGTSDMVPKAKTDGLTVKTVPGEWQGIILQDRAGKASAALGDVRVRQAINHALDRKAILETHYGGFGQVSTQTFNPASEAWVPELNERYPYDPAKAKELLAAAGYGNGFKIKISFSEGFMSPLVPIVAQYLSDVGITVEQVPVNGFANGGLETLKGQPAFMLSFSTNIPAWTDVLNKLTPTSLWNNFKYTDDTVTRLLKEIPAAQGDKQAALYKELNTHLVEQAWFAPIVTQENVYLFKPDIDVTMQQAQLMPSLRFFAPAK
ncbi:MULTISPECIES: ABC transporter substrate-binding protein [unclassified Micromonospora]|uniref:ABC transporter substrate-binding protein n=1 Tax=unclassified Micromonospora TaxID=2617518 RepID=UPI0022C5E6A6|nr:ABC transporter substrate-binding protein [Micromonospora sp. AKA38]GHJ12007.1 peptide ABC transporter substrate-binding protein [Micromonospora sp. AKA38]GHJ12744.1 peptide ABC transporter substrate-binding protein [Micromonospora sp. AKA38]GHJ18119.1 peptide ABC transporter substrate-binding protein [Micromonospora sp. AKA38]